MSVDTENNQEEYVMVFLSIGELTWKADCKFGSYYIWKDPDSAGGVYYGATPWDIEGGFFCTGRSIVAVSQDCRNHFDLMCLSYDNGIKALNNALELGRKALKASIEKRDEAQQELEKILRNVNLVKSQMYKFEKAMFKGLDNEG